MEISPDHKANWIVTDAEESIGRQVEELLSMGMSLREVAEELKISKSTVHRIKKGNVVPFEKRATC